MAKSRGRKANNSAGQGLIGRYKTLYLSRYKSSPPERLKSSAVISLTVLSAIIMALLDPFDIVTVTERASRDAVYRVTAPFYESNGFERITVILFRDSFTNLMAEEYEGSSISPYSAAPAWPAPRRYHAEILQKVLDAEPYAVFADITYHRGRGDPGENMFLAEMIRAYTGGETDPIKAAKAKRPAVLVADLGGNNVDDFNFGGMIGSAPVKILDAPNYPLCLTSSGRSRACIPQSRASPPRLSPALSLYLVECLRNPKRECSHRTVLPDLKEPMALVWRYRPDPNCGAPSAPIETWGEKITLSFRLLREGLAMFGDRHRSDQKCAPARTITAERLLRNDPANIDQFLKNRLVIIGANISEAPDLVASPPHGMTPGVYFHAMALDNLLKFGTDYRREAGGRFLGLSLNDGIEILLLVLIIGGAGLLSHREKKTSLKPRPDGSFPDNPLLDVVEDDLAGRTGEDRRSPEMAQFREQRRRQLRMIYCLAAYEASMVLAAFLLPAIFHLTPLNFIGLFMVAGPIVLTAAIRGGELWLIPSLDGGRLSQTWLTGPLSAIALVAAIILLIVDLRLAAAALAISVIAFALSKILHWTGSNRAHQNRSSSAAEKELST